MNDYTNTMNMISIPSPIKWTIMILIAINIFIYKKYKISRYLEENFSSYPLTYASLGFLIYATFVFATIGVDTFIEVFSTVLGFFMSLSYLTSVYKDVTDRKIGKKWFFIIFTLCLDLIIFYLIEYKMISYIVSLTQTLICMIYETKKKEAY